MVVCVVLLSLFLGHLLPLFSPFPLNNPSLPFFSLISLSFSLSFYSYFFSSFSPLFPLFPPAMIFHPSSLLLFASSLFPPWTDLFALSVSVFLLIIPCWLYPRSLYPSVPIHSASGDDFNHWWWFLQESPQLLIWDLGVNTMGQREEDTVRVVWGYAESWLQAAARRLKTKHLVLSSPGFEFSL